MPFQVINNYKQELHRICKKTAKSSVTIEGKMHASNTSEILSNFLVKLSRFFVFQILAKFHLQQKIFFVLSRPIFFPKSFSHKFGLRWGAAIVQWIRLRLPYYCPGFEYQAHHLCFLINGQIFELLVFVVALWKVRK